MSEYMSRALGVETNVEKTGRVKAIISNLLSLHFTVKQIQVETSMWVAHRQEILMTVMF